MYNAINFLIHNTTKYNSINVFIRTLKKKKTNTKKTKKQKKTKIKVFGFRQLSSDE